MSDRPKSRRHQAWDRIRLAVHGIAQGVLPERRNEDITPLVLQLIEAIKELEEFHRGPLYIGSVTLSQQQMSIVYDLVRIAYARKAGTDEGEPGWVKLRDSEAAYRRATADELRELLLTLGDNWTRLGLE